MRSGASGLTAEGDSHSKAKRAGRFGRLALYRLGAVPPEVLIFLFYLAVTIFMTWPLLVHFNTSVYGFPGDNLGGVWLNWWYKSAGSYGAKASFSPLAGYPFGSSTGFPLEFLAYIEVRFLLLFTSAVVAWNLDIVLSFVLSGVTMYYLVSYLARDRRVAFFGGFAYMVGVFHAYNAMFIGGAISATQWMPLYVLMLLRFLKRPVGKNAVYLALSGILVVGTSIHFGLFMAIFTIAFLLGRLFYIRVVAVPGKVGSRIQSAYRAVNQRTVLISLVVVLAVIVSVVPFYYLYVRSYNQPSKWPTSPTPGELRIIEYVEGGAASPGQYFLPNTMNPVFGSLAKKVAGDTTPNFGNAIYLGWIVIILAIAYFLLGWRQRWKGRRELKRAGDAGDRAGERSEGAIQTTGTLWGFAIAGICAFVFSLKPVLTIGSTKIPLPSYMLRIVAPWIRWYSRLAVVVSICLIVFACFGLKLLISHLNRRLLWGTAIGVFAVLIALEMSLVPPFKSFSFEEVPPIFSTISRMDSATTVAFYPMMEAGPFITSRLLFYQTIFRKPMINGAHPNSDGEALRRTVQNPYNPSTPGILRRMGLNHMVFFEGSTEGVVGQGQDARLLPQGLREVARYRGKDTFQSARLYEITAAPADIIPLYLGDISMPYIDEGGVTVRLLGTDNLVKFVNYSRRDKTVTVRLPLEDPFRQREVLIETTQGQILWQSVMKTGENAVAELKGLAVPTAGADLRVIVRGPSVSLPALYTTLFGVTSATLKMGDAQITEGP